MFVLLLTCGHIETRPFYPNQRKSLGLDLHASFGILSSLGQLNEKKHLHICMKVYNVIFI